MSSWYKEAREKLEQGVKEVKGPREGAMKQAVKNTLLDFCRQNDEFAQAVVQGGSFPSCMSAVAKGVGNSISDLEAYKKAVEFYFPGAKIDMQMLIQLEPTEEGPDTAENSGGILLDFSDFW